MTDEKICETIYSELSVAFDGALFGLLRTAGCRSGDCDPETYSKICDTIGDAAVKLADYAKRILAGNMTETMED